MAETSERIAIVTPYEWTAPHPVNDHVAEVADGLRALHEADPSSPDVLVIAPSADLAARRRARRAVRDLARGMDARDVLAAPELDAPVPGDRRAEPQLGWPLLALAPALGAASASVRSGINFVLEQSGVSVLAVHDPLEGDITRLAARRWDGLTVGVCHEEPSHGVRALLTAPGPLRERILDSVDRWLVPVEAPDMRGILAELIDVAPDRIGMVPTVASEPPRQHVPEVESDLEEVVPSASAVVVVRSGEDDAVVRELLRAMAALDEAIPDLHVDVLARWGSHHRPSAPRWLRGRMREVSATSRVEAARVLARAAAVIVPSPAPARALAESRSHAPVIEVGVGVVEQQVATALDRLRSVLTSKSGGGAAGRRRGDGLPTREELAGQLLVEVASLQSLRRPRSQQPGPGRAERNCLIDLHMHTNHSKDCATDPEALLYVAREVGLTAIAVTDHDEISGALACAELADEYGIQVIVGEEVMTQVGEVIGLFLTERVEPGMTWEDTVRAIRAQDGLVYVPHPFDRLHRIPDVNTLRDSIEDLDVLEVYNSRLTFDRYNRDAERFARKYNLIEGAGSDAHVPQGLGTAAVRMPAWDDPETFLNALRQGEILRRPKSLLYLQGLKRIHQVTGRAGTGKVAAED